MNIELIAEEAELKRKFLCLKTRGDVADLLEISETLLRKILYGVKERSRYRVFEIQKKSSKLRQISAPPKNISILQSKIRTVLQLIYEPKYCVHGFAKDKSILSNAKEHTCKRHVVNIDLKDFFPSINIGRITGALRSHPFNLGQEASIVIAQICCKSDGVLPQGGSTSPIVSNIICRSLDNDLMSFAKRNRCLYTRYADDITFSTSSFHLPNNLATALGGRLVPSEKLISTIEKHGFLINREKCRYAGRMSRQDVTGLTVNEFPNVQRRYIKSILGALHAWQKHGYSAANRKYLERYQQRHHSGLELREVLRGKIAFVKMVLGGNAPMFRKLAKKYNKLCDRKLRIEPLSTITPYPLRGSQPSGMGWRHWFDKYKESIFFIETQNPVGDKGTATAFHIGNDYFGTAGHNLKYENSTILFGGTWVSIGEHEFTKYDERAIDVGIIRKETGRDVALAWIPTQLRLPEVGEEVAAIGFPCLPQRQPTLVMHVGIVEALPVTYDAEQRLIQVSFQSGGGLSGGCLLDRAGFSIGVMIENIFLKPDTEIPVRPYGQAAPIEYLADKLCQCNL